MGFPQPSRAQRLNAARQRQHAGELDEAAAAYRALLAEDPNFADAWNLLGTIAIERRAYESAEHCLSRALAIRPRTGPYLHNMGLLHAVFGRFEEAERCYRESIRLTTEYAEAYFNLAHVVRWRPGDPFINQLEKQLKNKRQKGENVCHLHFAAGKYYDDIGETERAFAHFRKGNAAKAAPYKPEYPRLIIDALKSVFTSEMLAARQGEGDPSDRPVFVVGMPRSGTSLVEQILASHPDVHGAGELPDLDAAVRSLPGQTAQRLPYPLCVPELPPQAILAAAGRYLQKLDTLSAAARRVVDKAPLNFWHLGLIAVLFPNARVIHLQRDPRDSCLSCYFKNFRDNHFYSFDQTHLGAYYRHYEDLMAYWRAVLPRPILDVRYETLVERPEEIAREMVAYCGLEWDPACARPEHNTRPVETASQWQVRQPVNTRAVARWRRYERHIEPLLDALGPISEDGARLA